MYSENVEIIVDGKIITVNVCCIPNMPKDKLKQLAIGKYIAETKRKLYKENNCEQE